MGQRFDPVFGLTELSDAHEVSLVRDVDVAGAKGVVQHAVHVVEALRVGGLGWGEVRGEVKKGGV